MLFRLFISIVMLSGLFSCSNSDVSVKNRLEVSIDSLKKADNFDKSEEILDWSLDTLENNKIVFTVKTTDKEIAKKAVEIAKEYKLVTVIKNLPTGELAKTPYAIVNTSIANMRVKPSRSAGMATQVIMGMKLQLLDNKGKWYRAKTPQGYIAWIVKSSFEFLTVEQADKFNNLQKAMITTSTTFAYNIDDHTQVESDLVYGNVVVLDKFGKDFTKIILPGNRNAVVKTEDITELYLWQKEASFDKNKLINMAYQYMGQPYLWGGNSFKGNDCSGYSAAIYYSLGVLLPRDAYQQAKQGDRVDYKVGEKDGFKNLEVGDLLFFGGKRVTHVAVWLGNNEYTHNSSGYGRVYVSSVDPKANNYSQSLVDILLDVRRINGSENLDKTIDLRYKSIW